jgi:hypothetical protein
MQEILNLSQVKSIEIFGAEYIDNFRYKPEKKIYFRFNKN